MKDIIPRWRNAAAHVAARGDSFLRDDFDEYDGLYSDASDGHDGHLVEANMTKPLRLPLAWAIACIWSGCSDQMEPPLSTMTPDPGMVPSAVAGRTSMMPGINAQPTSGRMSEPVTGGTGPQWSQDKPMPTAGMNVPPPSAGRGPIAGGAGMISMSSSGVGAAGSGPAPSVSGGRLLPVDTTDGPGPYTEVVKMKNVPPGGWLIYPKNIGMANEKHPIFLWGPGGGTTPVEYDMKGHYDRWVSYGFVVYSPAMSTGNGTELKAGLDWLLMENESSTSPVYHKLDTTKVAAAGHSQGSITTFAFATDPRLTTTLHISGGSFDGKGPDKLSKPTAYICGGADTLAMSNCSRDFTNTSKVPVYFALMDGVDHISAAREAWAPMIAWLRWHLAGEEKWKKEFLEPTGTFQKGKFHAMVKNW